MLARLLLAILSLALMMRPRPVPQPPIIDLPGGGHEPPVPGGHGKPPILDDPPFPGHPPTPPTGPPGHAGEWPPRPHFRHFPPHGPDLPPTPPPGHNGEWPPRPRLEDILHLRHCDIGRYEEAPHMGATGDLAIRLLRGGSDDDGPAAA